MPQFDCKPTPQSWPFIPIPQIFGQHLSSGLPTMCNLLSCNITLGLFQFFREAFRSLPFFNSSSFFSRQQHLPAAHFWSRAAAVAGAGSGPPRRGGCPGPHVRQEAPLATGPGHFFKPKAPPPPGGGGCLAQQPAGSQPTHTPASNSPSQPP